MTPPMEAVPQLATPIGKARVEQRVAIVQAVDAAAVRVDAPAVVEPPHRPDREQPLLHDVVNRVFRLPPADQAAFVDHAVAFLDGAEGYPP